MRLARALLTLSLFRPAAPKQTLRFADITWGDAPATVERKLVAGGFTLAGTDNGDVGFRGRVASYDGDGWIYFARGHAVKALFVVRPAAPQVVGIYERMRAALLRQYGPTRHNLEAYAAPYARGDGHEADALRAGKLTLACAWRDGPDDGPLKGDDPGIILRATPEMSVKLSFEGPAWTAESARRRAAGER